MPRLPGTAKVSSLLLLFLAGVSPPTFADRVLPPEALFAVRSGQAPYQAVESILNKPTKIYMSVTSQVVKGQRVIRSETDFHAIFPLPLKPFLDELMDYKNDKNIFPRVVGVKLVYADPNPFGLHRVHEYISMRVLGFGGDYEYITNNYIERSGKGYLQKFNLQDSPGDMFYEMLGSFYIEEIRYNGKPYTYIRQYSILGLQSGASIPLELAMQTFGALQMKGLLLNLYKGVRKRYEASRHVR